MKPDPITIEILRNAFIMAAEEMNAALIRSAYTPVIYESKDCAVALIDSNHRVLGQSSGVPLFLGNLEACTLATEEMFGRSVWGRGDIWIMNDAYLTGTHMHDVTVFAPIFYQGDLAGFAASRAHWLDIGAKDPGVPMDSVEIFQEGVRLPPTLVVRNGEPVQDIWDIIEANVRFPRSAIGDMTAQFAVASIGEHRLGALFDRYGRDVVEAAAEEIFRQSEQLDREAIRAIPDGVYTSEGFLDSDGVGDDPVRVKVTITVEGERLLFDLTGTDGPGQGPINCGAVQTLSACRLAFKYLFNSHHPVNGGTFRPLEVITKPGSILHARVPRRLPVLLHPPGPDDRPDLLSALPRPRRHSPRRPLRRRHDLPVHRHQPPHRRTVPRQRTPRGRMGCLTRSRRRGRHDLDPVRQLPRHAHRSLRVQVPRSHHRVRLPTGLRRPRPLARRQRHHPRVPDDHRHRDEPLVRTLRQPRLGPLRRPGRSTPRSHHQPRNPPRNPPPQDQPHAPWPKATPSAATPAAEAATATPQTATPKPSETTWPTATSPPTTPDTTIG